MFLAAGGVAAVLAATRAIGVFGAVELEAGEEVALAPAVDGVTMACLVAAVALVSLGIVVARRG